MKYIHFLTPALLLFAACSNSNQNQNTGQDNAPTESHSHDEMPAQPDTAVIKPGQRVFFENVVEGQEIKLPFVVKFGVEGMEVEPAQGVNPDKGHHHLLLDQDYIPAGIMIPMGKEKEGFLHFGKGQTSDTLSLAKNPTLTPGKHTLRLQFANGLHQSYGVLMSAGVNVIIK